MKYKLELTLKQIQVLEQTVLGAFLDTLAEEDEPRDRDAATENRILNNILAKIEELK